MGRSEVSLALAPGAAAVGGGPGSRIIRVDSAVERVIKCNPRDGWSRRFVCRERYPSPIRTAIDGVKQASLGAAGPYVIADNGEHVESRVCRGEHGLPVAPRQRALHLARG